MRQMSVDHSYEELRSIVVDILVGREKTRYPPEQYSNLVSGVGEVLARRGSAAAEVPYTGSPALLSKLGSLPPEGSGRAAEAEAAVV